MLLFYISHGYGSESTKSVSQTLPGADGTADCLWVIELRSLCLYTPPSTGLSCCPSQGLQRWPPVGKVSRALQSAPSPNHAAAGEERGGTPCSSWDLSWSSKASGPGFGRRQVGRRQSMVSLACAVKKNNHVPISSLGLEGETSARQARVQAIQNHGCA